MIGECQNAAVSRFITDNSQVPLPTVRDYSIQPLA